MYVSEYRELGKIHTIVNMINCSQQKDLHRFSRTSADTR